MSPRNIRVLFFVAALYDFVLGLVFALGFKSIYTRLGIELPNHDMYVQLPGLLIAVFGVGFYMVYRNPAGNVNIIKLGVLLKLVFAGLVLLHYFWGPISLPGVYVPFAVVDLIFMVLFIIAANALARPSGGDAAGG